MPGKFGPNTDQVDRFLEGLRRLGPAQRRTVAAIRRSTREAHAYFAARDAVAREALGQAAAAAQAAAESAAAEVAAGAAAEAVLGLVIREFVDEAVFSRLYLPFASVIPLARLESPPAVGARRQVLRPALGADPV